MINNTPHSLWPSYSEEIYFNIYHHQGIKNNRNAIFIDIPLSTSTSIRFCFTKLEWDSLHFGYACYKLDIRAEKLKNVLLYQDIVTIKSAIAKIVHDLNIRFIFADIESADPFLNDLVQKIGFTFIVNWLDGFIETKSISKAEVSRETEEVTTQDIEWYANLASKHYYKGGRFYSDSNFDKARVDDLYASLIRNSMNDSNILITEKINGVPAGLFICKKIIQYDYHPVINVAHLRFLLLNPQHRGHKIGEKLYMKTLSYLQDRCDIVTTGIETHNIVSLNLHCKLGFKFNYSHNAYHYWNNNL